MNKPTFGKLPFTKENYLAAILPRLQQKRVKNFTTLVLTLITLSFFGFFAISPTLSTIADLQKQISDDQTVNSSLQTKITNLSSLQEQYQSLQPDLTYVLSDLPQTPQLHSFIGEVQTLGLQNGVNIITAQTFAVDITSNSVEKYTATEFSLEATGSYQNLSQFLNSLTTFNRGITLEDISLSRSGGTNNILYQLSVRGKVYFKE